MSRGRDRGGPDPLVTAPRPSGASGPVPPWRPAGSGAHSARSSQRVDLRGGSTPAELARDTKAAGSENLPVGRLHVDRPDGSRESLLREHDVPGHLVQDVPVEREEIEDVGLRRDLEAGRIRVDHLEVEGLPGALDPGLDIRLGVATELRRELDADDSLEAELRPHQQHPALGAAEIHQGAGGEPAAAQLPDGLERFPHDAELARTGERGGVSLVLALDLERLDRDVAGRVRAVPPFVESIEARAPQRAQRDTNRGKQPPLAKLSRERSGVLPQRATHLLPAHRGAATGAGAAGCGRRRFRQWRRWTPTMRFRMNDRNGKTSLRRLTKNRHDIRQLGQLSLTTPARYARFSCP